MSLIAADTDLLAWCILVGEKIMIEILIIVTVVLFGIIVTVVIFGVWFLIWVSGHIEIGYVNCPKCKSDEMVIQDYFLICRRCGKNLSNSEINRLIDGGEND
jgi:phage FluMu protein Com